MKVGGKRKLIIPPALGYGERGAPPDIPPNAMLVFDVQLLGLPDQEDYASLRDAMPGLPLAGERQEKAQGIAFHDLEVGVGEELLQNDAIVTASITGYLTDGTKLFDSGEAPREIQLGTPPIGMTDGMMGMRVGGTRKIIVPAELAFGPNGGGSIPANATIIFDIKLAGIVRYDAIPIEAELPGDPVTGERVTTDSGLMYYDLVMGDGPQPADASSKVTVHYSGWLNNGTSFDSSVQRGTPATFALSGVIAGWTEGVGSMRVGGKRKLVIPFTLAYGAAGRPPQIPPRATLIFDIELLGVADAPPASGDGGSPE
jgi:peptidylprolyl isomerase